MHLAGARHNVLCLVQFPEILAEALDTTGERSPSLRLSHRAASTRVRRLVDTDRMSHNLGRERGLVAKALQAYGFIECVTS
jgi:hypothetical protein